MTSTETWPPERIDPADTTPSAPGSASPATPGHATVALIAAVDRQGGIGRANGLLIHLPGDLPRFKRLTLGSPIVMGRKTWDSIGRPLPGRRSIVVTRDAGWHAAGAEAAGSLEAALALAAGSPKLFVVGGGELYALALPRADELLLTEIDAEFPADTFFPRWDRAAFTEVSRERQTADGVPGFSYVVYRRKPIERI